MVLHNRGPPPPPPGGGWELYRVVELVGVGSVINGATLSSSRRLGVIAFCMIFSVFQKKSGVWGILGPPSYGIGATIRIGREMLCLPYAGFLFF